MNQPDPRPDAWRPTPLRLSILDQSVAVAGRPQDASIRETLALAELAESLGYQRFWVSEHHSHPTIVGSAPEVGARLRALASRLALDEIVVITWAHDPAARRRSYQLLAAEFGLS